MDEKLYKLMQEKKDLFWDKVYVGTADEDWPWLGDTRDDGYGYWEINHDGGHTRVGAHIASYTFMNGPYDKDELVLLHKCDNRICVNPHHLEPGPQQENMDDMEAKGRSADGEDAPKAKLTNEQVRELRRRYAKGEVLTDLANEFGITKSTASYIVNFKTWLDA